MEDLSILPVFITTLFKTVPIIFRHKHKVILMWYIYLLALGVGDSKLMGMAKYGSFIVTRWRFQRLLDAKYWCIKSVLVWLVEKVMKSLPKPEDGTIYLVVDGSKKEKRSKKNPFVQKGKIRQTAGWFVGVRFCVLMVQWRNFRIPVDFRLLYPTKHKKHATENETFLDMLTTFKPPSWCRRVVLLADCAYASKKVLKHLKEKAEIEKDSTGIIWGFVFALPKTNKFSDGKSLSDLCKSLNKKHYKKIFIPSINGTKKRCYWVYKKQCCLRYSGDVTILLSKKGYNLGPKQVKVIVTNLPNVNAKQIADIYQRRFMIEVLFRELKSGLGLGKQQVTSCEDRIEKAIGGSFLAYLLLLKVQHHDISAGKSWSIMKLRENFRLQVLREQKYHEIQLMERKMKKAA